MIMFVLIPPYLLAMMALMHRRTHGAVDALAAIADESSTRTVRSSLDRFPALGGAIMIVVMALYGIDQNGRILATMIDSGGYHSCTSRSSVETR